MMPPRSVLAAVDFSEPSRVALEFAARLAQQCQATLHVLHVENPLLAAAARARGIELMREACEELARFTAATTAGNLSATRHHVVPALTVLERWQPHADAIVQEHITTARREIAAALTGVTPHHEIPLRIETGSVPERLAAATSTWPGQHPILVLGRHARGSRRGVPGSTAYRVLGLAKVPVLVSCVAEGCP